jgi:hypothetical protein
LALVIVADGTGVNDSTAGRVAEEEEARDLFSLGVPRDYRCSYSADQNHSYTILFSFHNRGRKQVELSCINYGYHYMHVIIIHVTLDFLFEPMPSLATALEMLVGIS